MAQWVGYGSGRTHESRVTDAEAVLRRAVESLLAVDPDSAVQARRNVLGLAEKLLSARTRLIRARLSQKRERVGAQNGPDPESLAPMERNISEIQLAGVAGILHEFGVLDVESVVGSRPKKSPERTREE